MRPFVVAGTLAVLALAAGGCGPAGDGTPPAGGGSGGPAGAGRPNVVLLSIDTLRPDHLACYGYGRPTSPAIDGLAADGALFENAISSTSWTLPAHTALFTGLDDAVHGVTDSDRRLDAGRVTLAERFRDAGWETAGFFSGPYLNPAFGLGQGFDTYVDCSSYADLARRTVETTGGLQDARVESASHRDVTSPRLLAAAREWLDARASDRPFFLFVHFWDPHFDYIPPPPFDTMFDPDYTGAITGENFFFDDAIGPGMDPRDLEHVVSLYDGEIAWTDRHVGLLLDALDALPGADSTVVVLVSDHGTEFLEHGGKLHRRTLYDEVIRIPMIVRAPGRVPPGRRVAEQVRIVDVVPTVLELAGLPPAEEAMGASLVPLLSGRPWDGAGLPAVSELRTSGLDLRSFRRPGRKLVEDAHGPDRLYDLAADPGEQAPLRDPAPGDPLVQALAADAAAGERWIEAHGGEAAVGAGSTIPAGVRRQLESLGYLGGGGDDAAADDDAPDPFAVEWTMASSLIDVGRTGEAIDRLAALADEYPDSANVRGLLGSLLVGAGRDEAAAARFGEVVALDPDFLEARLDLANALMRLQRPGEAVPHYLAVVEAEPRRVEAHEALGRAFLSLGRTGDAVTAFRNVAALRPDDPDTQANLGIVLRSLGRTDEAIAALERALALDPEHARARRELDAARAESR